MSYEFEQNEPQAGIYVQGFIDDLVRLPHDAQAQADACKAIADGVQDFWTTPFVERNVHTHIIQAMERHPDDARVQKHACTAIALLADHQDSDYKLKLINEGAFTNIVHVIKTSKDACALAESISAIWILALYDVRTMNACADAIEHICDAMRAHPKDTYIQHCACYALAVFAKRGLPDYAVNLIINAMQEHQEYDDLVASACYALGELKNIGDSQTKAAALHAVLAVKQLHPSKDGLDVQDYARGEDRDIEPLTTEAFIAYTHLMTCA
jgi:hypothetical protein